jgi:hypothetical protein
VKADVAQHVFAFGKVPPNEYLKDTVELLLRTIEVEAAPKAYVDELRQIAKRSGSHLLPPPRFVLVGAALGELPVLHFSPREEPKKPAPPRIAAAPPAAVPNLPAAAPLADRAITADEGYEFPPLQPPAAAASAPPAPAAPAAPVTQTQTSAAPIAAPVPPADVLPAPFRKPREQLPQEETPFGAPFAVPPTEAFGAPPAGIPPSSTWQWEPPEGEDDGAETPFGPKP